MTDVVAIIAGVVALIAALYRDRKRKAKPRLPWPVDDGPGLDLMAKTRREYLEACAGRTRMARKGQGRI